MDDADGLIAMEDNTGDPYVTAGSDYIPGSDPFIPKTNPGFLPDPDKKGKYPPLSHGMVNLDWGIDDVIKSLGGAGFNLGEILYQQRTPTMSELSYAATNLFVTGSAINKFMGSTWWEPKGFYLSMVQVAIGALASTSANKLH